ncbi:SusD/RagB family nutrient-binding outer membrane lipoprotein [Puteibacter caeruleilacunae]|nr:SusD/RagB family nutrient-binding outer membrane lipoprotein [Puteibacter caeruleilacunae]
MKKIIYIFLLGLIASACGDMDEINLNPDKPVTVTPDFLVTYVLNDATYSPKSKWLLSDSWLMKSTSFTEHMEWYLYNKFERDHTYSENFGNYEILINSKKMRELAEADEFMTTEEKNGYLGFDHFMRAFYFYKTTMAMGDVPCSEALEGEDGNTTPKYDPQEDVFHTIITELQTASQLFDSGSSFKGDFVYNGNTDLWKRATNSFLLRVLNMLSSKTTVKGVNVKELFEQTATKPLLENETNSFQRVYSESKSSQWYPFYFENQNWWSFPVMTNFLVDMMKDLNDYRLFYYAEPAPNLVSVGGDSFDAYSGVNPVLPYGQVQTEYTNGDHSSINKRYYRVPQGEPIKFIAYSEIQFILAEAALRGWNTPSSAKAHYDNGVRAAMLFTGNNTPADYNHGRVIDGDYVDAYLAGEAAFDSANGLEQIMTQKYIAAFVQLPFNSFFDYRRTGFPNLPIDPATNMNEVKTQLPLRWMYPMKEYSLNRENIEAAIDRQFDGSDTPNDIMWLLKN